MTLQTVRITRRFDASAERVFDAWLDPATVGRWLFATPTGRMVRVEIDARVGGSFEITERRDGEDVEHVGTYLEIDRPRRLVFTFTVAKYSKQSTRVSIEMRPLPMGCELALVHEGVLSEYAERTREGWGKILDGLAASLNRIGGYGIVVEPGTIRFERVLPGPIERVWAYLTASEERGRWLASGEMEARVGGSVALRFHHASLSTAKAEPPERFKKYENGVVGHERVTRFEPPRLLGLTWSGGADGGKSEVTIELTPQGDNVLLVLTHRGLADRTAVIGVAVGWHSHLTVLAERLAGREPPAFWSIFAGIDGEYEQRLAGG